MNRMYRPYAGTGVSLIFPITRVRRENYLS